MEVLIGSNFYNSIKIWHVSDSTNQFLMHHMSTYAYKHYSDEDQEPIEEYLAPYLPKEHPDLVIPTLLPYTTKDGMVTVYGHPGFIYIRSTINELRKMKNTDALLFHMVAPNERFVVMEVQLRQLGYGISEDSMQNTLTDWLISMPGPKGPTDIDKPEYISTDCIKSMSYGKSVIL